MSFLNLGIEAVERGLVPDFLTRWAIRSLCRHRIMESRRQANTVAAEQIRFVESMRSGPLALVPELANEQHYELPPEFFQTVLGPHRKYSCCFWSDESRTLADAEEASLRITCERAQIEDGMEILELGCGWGSLSLWMAEHYPNCRITAVSNSAPQRKSIEGAAKSRQLPNLRVITADMNDFAPTFRENVPTRFDRVVSVEMFEHMRNYELLLERISSWLKPTGKLFVHIFCHRELLYPFETEGDVNWMGRHFFTGGIMPSSNLLRSFDQSMRVTQQWTWNGVHYQKTSEAWLENMDQNRRDILKILDGVYGQSEANRWFHRWRIFFLAVAELFGFAGGDEWYVSHYLLEQAG